ncbi:hypothetical protein O1157_14760 [Streptomyces albogriseolus]
MNTIAQAEAVKLPALEGQTSPQVGSLYLWEDFTDAHHILFEYHAGRLGIVPGPYAVLQ